MNKSESITDKMIDDIGKKWGGVSRRGKVFVVLGGFILLLLWVSDYKSKSSSNSLNYETVKSESVKSEWNILCGNVYPGVKVYYGIDKSYWGTVLGSSGDYVQVRMSDGSVELKDRKVVICGGGRMENIQLFVRRDDPALK